MDVRLVMFKENGERKDFPLGEGVTLIGRQDECDLRIPLSEISRKHAQLIIHEGAVTLRDMGSANGTYVNNRKITEKEALAKASNPQALEMNFKGIFLDEARRILT